MTDAQIKAHHDRQNLVFADDIDALPDSTVISYDRNGKHVAYTAEYIKRFVREWRDSRLTLGGEGE